MDMKKIAALTAAAMLVFSGCSDMGKTSSSENASVSVSGAESVSPAETAVSGAENINADGQIIFNGVEAQISGKGISAEGSTVVVSAAGEYAVSGSTDNGQIIVDAPDNAKVRLILNGVSLKNESTSAIYVKSADKAIIELAEGSVNILSDCSKYSDEDETDACIYSKDDLKINGKGSLTVNGNGNHGIHGKDDVEIEDGSICVLAVNDGIKGKDSVQISGGNVTVVSEGDGICSNNSDEEGKGTVNISGGSINITSGGGAENAKQKTESFFNFRKESSVTDEDNVSCKGIKSAGDMTVSGGVFTLDCCDDAFHSNGNILISGGEFLISSGDDGIHADADLSVSGGKGEIIRSYEGLEGTAVVFSGGDWSVTASDDGVNSAGGSDSTSGRQQDMFAVNENNVIKVTGGKLFVNADGDGLDSNGSLEMSGGEVYIDGPVNSANGALDFNGTGIVTGGVLCAAGASGMAQTPSEGSTQNTLAVTFTSERAAGTEISVKTADGDEIFSYAPSKKFGSVIISLPELASGCVVYENGKELFTADITSVITTVNEKGEAVNGMGGFGGRGGKGDFGGGKPGFNADENGEMPERPDMNGEKPKMPRDDRQPPEMPMEIPDDMV
ncbi:MAG: carbohydrate-binding domain-containing protein [Huintestinicola sp.]